MLLCQNAQCCPDGSLCPSAHATGRYRAAANWKDSPLFWHNDQGNLRKRTMFQFAKCHKLLEFLVFFVKFSNVFWLEKYDQYYQTEVFQLSNLDHFFSMIVCCQTEHSRCLKDKVHDCTGGLGLETPSFRKSFFFFHRTLNFRMFLFVGDFLVKHDVFCDFVIFLGDFLGILLWISWVQDRHLQSKAPPTTSCSENARRDASRRVLHGLDKDSGNVQR